MNERTCIVTKKSASAATLIRFVIGPNNQIIPDLKANLPGRGLWVSAHHTIIEKAVKHKVFSKNLKTDVEVSENLAHIVDKLLLKTALASLSMARKAGTIVTGSAKVISAIRADQVILVLHAKEAKEDGKRKISQAIHAIQQRINQNIKVTSLFTSDEMSMAFGTNPVIHAALLNTKAAEGFIKAIYKLITYREDKCNKLSTITANAVKEIQ
ncbi:RNA-binding protein [Bartonella bilalgolemii]|uniref:RNA-binding protein n=1 Tax=Bartonella bilalgolemii TaxID=2942911 RepID=A0ABT0P9Q8_9HYPH|nr:RNA-binding protein [Bartonella sp. G70]MCL6229967.1 RNA-binding protein [Bartonella sp. G70]